MVGVGDDEMFIASFTPAFLSETRNVQYVGEGEIVERGTGHVIVLVEAGESGWVVA